MHTKHDQPLRVLHTVLVLLRVTEGGNLDAVGFIDLFLGTVTNEDGLATPLDDNLLSTPGLISIYSKNAMPDRSRTFLPSGIAPRPTSTLAWARTSAEADMLTKKSA